MDKIMQVKDYHKQIEREGKNILLYGFFTNEDPKCRTLRKKGYVSISRASDTIECIAWHKTNPIIK